MFGRKRDAPAPEQVAHEATDRDEQAIGKGTPTPKRKTQEAARKRPLVPDDRKAAKVANRESARADRERTRRALDTGEERYLPARDKGEQRRFARDMVDARFNAGEYLMIAALVFVMLTLVPNPSIQTIILLVFWVAFLIVFVDGFLLSRRVKRRLTEKFGMPERGVGWYAVMRSIQIRRLRLPKPQVKRGQHPQ